MALLLAFFGFDCACSSCLFVCLLRHTCEWNVAYRAVRLNDLTEHGARSTGYGPGFRLHIFGAF